jgi:membrane fusion protein, multidrug efflux system
MNLRTTWWKWLIALAVLAAIGLGAARVLKGRDAAAKPVSAASAPAVAMDLVDSDVARVTRTALTQGVAISGGLKASTSAFVKARVAGELKSLTVREGDRVRAGQVIGLIDTTEFDWRLRQAEQTASSARAQLDIARRNQENNKALVNQGFISPTALQTSASNEAAADANWQAALAAVELARKAKADATLTAPIAGIVSQRLSQPGERVALDARIVEIVDLSRLEFEAAVPAEDVGSIQIGQLAELRVDGLPQTVPARVSRINPSTQAGTRAVLVYLAVDGAAGLRQGLFASGSIRLPARDALVVPASAVRSDQPRPYVLVVDGSMARARPLRVGATGDAKLGELGKLEAVVEVLPIDGDTSAKPLAAGDVVLRGTVGNLRDGTAVRVAGAPAR